MTKNPVFAERLKRAEHNVANRLKRRGAATSAPTKAFTDASPYHQRLAQFEAWRESDPYLSLAVLNNNKIGSGATSAAGVGEQNDEQLVRDLHAVKSDLIGKKVLALLRGAEDVHGDVENGGDVVNVFDQRVTSETASSVEQPSRRGSLGAMSLHTTESEESAVAVVKTGEDEDGGLGGEEGNEGGGSVRLSIMDGSLQPSTDTSVTEETSTAMTVSVDERNLSEYEAKLHRYSSKVKMEISERLRKPSGTYVSTLR